MIEEENQEFDVNNEELQEMTNQELDSIQEEPSEDLYGYPETPVEENQNLDYVESETSEPVLEPAVADENQEPLAPTEEVQEEVKAEENTNLLAIQNRKAKLKYNIRAICVIDEVYKILEEAINEDINEYKFMYAFEGKLYTIGYENKGRCVFALWNPDGTVKTYDSIDNLQRGIILGDEITILREFVTGNEGKAVEVSIEDNFMLKNFLVHNNNKDFNRNMSEPISAAMQKLADSHVEKLDKNSKLTILIVVIAIVVLLILLFTVFK